MHAIRHPGRDRLAVLHLITGTGTGLGPPASDPVLDATLDAREQAFELGAIVGVEAGAGRPYGVSASLAGRRDDSRGRAEVTQCLADDGHRRIQEQARHDRGDD
jgi:hypothetical protein